MQRDFPAKTRLTVYPPGTDARSVVIQGNGHWTLRFESTDDPNLASVRLIDAQITLEPFNIDYDSDGDGRLEVIEVDAIALQQHDFDLETSKGTLNRETGEFSMTVAHNLTPETIPLLKELGIDPLRFSFTETGNMDLASGTFTTHSPIFSLPEPLQTINIGAGENPCCPKKPTFLKVWPEFICDKQCVTGGNVVYLVGQVKHFQEGKACKPSKFNTEIRNNTENQKLVPVPQSKWIYGPIGVYSLPSGVKDTVDTDIAKKKLPNNPKTTYEMTAFTPDCDPVTNIEQVTVLSKSRRFHICTVTADISAGTLSVLWDAQLSGDNSGEPIFSSTDFGKDIYIGLVKNPSTNPYTVKVSYGGYSDIISPGSSSKVFSGKQPGYSWKVEILGGTESFERYKHNPEDFCLDVWLFCNCGKE